MKKRRLWNKRYRRGWRRTGYKEFGRQHRISFRRYCSCGKSFNIFKAEKQGHMHAPEHEDYGECCEERNECRHCLEGFIKWSEANTCRHCSGQKPRSKHGKITSEFACKCPKFEPCNHDAGIHGEYKRSPDNEEMDLEENW